MKKKPEAVRGIHTVFLQVSDFKRSVAFYRDVIGIPFGPIEPGDDAALVRFQGARFAIHQDFDPSLRGAMRRGAGIVVHFDVADADAFHDALVERGARPENPPEDRPWGREFAIEDPDGYEIAFIGPAAKNR